MCGIAGMLYLDGRTPSLSTLQDMAGSMYHRGPDDAGFHLDGPVGLAFRRLSIIDLEEGAQPLCNEDGTIWIVFNGEIYNYRALREQLQHKGHRFKTGADTEVIIHLYEEYGEDCVHHLRGMFGFVIWDSRKRRLFGARDPFGIKPFYYVLDREKLVFASEIKCLLRIPGLERKVQQESLFQYLTFQYVPDPLTMYEGVKKLPPAHRFTVSPEGKFQMERYWDPMFEPEDRPLESYVEELREKLKDSVKHHLVSDVKRGCFLSSGIDSTAIATYMNGMEPIKTFSVGFDGPQNETIIAEETARAIGTDHYSRVITKDDFFDSLPQAVWNQDEPVADPSAIALFHVAKLAKEHVTVVLSGEGADELFGGYRIYREPQALAALSWLPGSMQSFLHRVVKQIPGSWKGKNYLLRATTPLERRFLGNAKIFDLDMKRELLDLAPEIEARYRDEYAVTKPLYDSTAHLDPVSRMQYIDLNLWMPGDILMKADRMTMAHSLELRVPFLDKEVFDLARRIPQQYRIAQGTTKYVFRQAMKGIIPDFILNRPKLGFPVPLRQWLKEEPGERIMDELRTETVKGFFDQQMIEKMYWQHRYGEQDHARKLWTLYMFAMWHQTFLQPESAPEITWTPQEQRVTEGSIS